MHPKLIQLFNDLYNENGSKIKVSKEIIEYCYNHSDQINQVQKDLIKYTNEMSKESYMLTDSDENQFFKILLKLVNAKKVIDIGVYTGLSSLSFALELPDDGKVYALEFSDQYVDVCHSFWNKANVDHKIELIIQDAKKSLAELCESNNGENIGTFDFIFIDADKLSYDQYYEYSLKLIRPGGIIVIDNVLFFGSALVNFSDRSNTPLEHEKFMVEEGFIKMAESIQKLNEKILNDTRVIKTMLPLNDGITLVTKK